jgi:hypothetical protein
MAFDINSTDEVAEREERGTRVIVKNELGVVQTYVDDSGNTVESYILIAGANSLRYKKKKAQQDLRKIERKTFVEGKWGDDQMELTVACTIEWNGIVAGGAPFRFTPHNAAMLYGRAKWIYDAVVQAMEEPANFLQTSSNGPALTSGEPHDS